MCDQGNTLLFNSEGFEIKRKRLGILGEMKTVTPNNIYILNEIGKETF